MAFKRNDNTIKISTLMMYFIYWNNVYGTLFKVMEKVTQQHDFSRST